jgi:UDP-glucose 4-epimerase
VRELLSVVESVAGHPIAKREEPRRAGDPPTLVARATRIRDTLDWQPRHDDLTKIVTTSLEWERKLAAGHWRS